MIPENYGLKILKNISKCSNGFQKKFLTEIGQKQYAELSKVLYSHSPKEPFSLIQNHLQNFTKNMTKILSENNVTIGKVVSKVINSSGKRIRPSLNILVACALRTENSDESGVRGKSGVKSNIGGQNPNSPSSFYDLNFDSVFEKQKRLAEVTELVHTGSILHDDVVDESDLRRGEESMRKKFGNKIAVLGGDFFLAKASSVLSRIQNHAATALISQAIENLVAGELLNVEWEDEFEVNDLLEVYSRKNYLKTSSLIANSCKAVAVIGGADEKIVDSVYGYGANLGLSFQVIDDILDVKEEAETGKPKGIDVEKGIITAPSIYAAEEIPKIRPLLKRKAQLSGGKVAISLALSHSKALEKSKRLAEFFAVKAVGCALKLPPSDFRDAMISFVRFNLSRDN